MQRSKGIQIQSIQYVHDPEAASLWFDLYVEMVKDKLLARQSNKIVPDHNIEQEQVGEGIGYESRSVLSKFD